MAAGHIPASRNDKLYAAVLETLRITPEPMSMADLRQHKRIAPLLKGERSNRIGDVVVGLHKKHQIQIGYDETGKRLATSIDKPAPGAKSPPETSIYKNRKPRGKARTPGEAAAPKPEKKFKRVRRVDFEMYDTVMRTLEQAPGVMHMHELRMHPDVAPFLKGTRTARMNEVVNGLKGQGKIHFGFDDENHIVVASLGKDFPYRTKLPKGQRSRFKKFSTEDVATAMQRAAEKAIQEAPAAAPVAPAAPVAAPLMLASSLSLDHLAIEFANQIANALCVRIVDALNAQLPARVNELVDQFQNGTLHTKGKQLHQVKPKAIIAGLLPHQAGLMVQEFGSMLDLSFVESQEASNSKRIDALVASHDVAFAMTGFMSHSLYGKLRGAKEFRHVSGGMTTLRKELQDYITGHVPSAAPQAQQGQQPSQTH